MSGSFAASESEGMFYTGGEQPTKTLMHRVRAHIPNGSRDALGVTQVRTLWHLLSRIQTYVRGVHGICLGRTMPETSLRMI